MEDWKERLKTEYEQTKERYEKLKSWNNKNEVQLRLFPSGVNAEDGFNADLCREQQIAMENYLHFLELRAVLNGITL